MPVSGEPSSVAKSCLSGRYSNKIHNVIPRKRTRTRTRSYCPAALRGYEKARECDFFKYFYACLDSAKLSGLEKMLKNIFVRFTAAGLTQGRWNTKVRTCFAVFDPTVSHHRSCRIIQGVKIASDCASSHGPNETRWLWKNPCLISRFHWLQRRPPNIPW